MLQRSCMLWTVPTTNLGHAPRDPAWFCIEWLVVPERRWVKRLYIWQAAKFSEVKANKCLGGLTTLFSLQLGKAPTLTQKRELGNQGRDHEIGRSNFMNWLTWQVPNFATQCQVKERYNQALPRRCRQPTVVASRRGPLSHALLDLHSPECHHKY